MDLDSLSSVAGQSLINGSNLNLQVIYKSAMLSSAHFRYMAEDWTAGQSCLNSEQDDVQMRQAFERYDTISHFITNLIYAKYSCAQCKPIKSHFMKQNAKFQEGILQC